MILGESALNEPEDTTVEEPKDEEPKDKYYDLKSGDVIKKEIEDLTAEIE